MCLPNVFESKYFCKSIFFIDVYQEGSTHKHSNKVIYLSFFTIRVNLAAQLCSAQVEILFYSFLTQQAVTQTTWVIALQRLWYINVVPNSDRFYGSFCWDHKKLFFLREKGTQRSLHFTSLHLKRFFFLKDVFPSVFKYLQWRL